MDAKLFKKPIAQKVASFFDLDFEQVKWKKDPHYYTIKQQIQTDKKYIPYSCQSQYKDFNETYDEASFQKSIKSGLD